MIATLEYMADQPTRVIRAEALEPRQSSVIVSQMLAGKQQMGEMAQP